MQHRFPNRTSTTIRSHDGYTVTQLHFQNMIFVIKTKKILQNKCFSRARKIAKTKV